MKTNYYLALFSAICLVFGGCESNPVTPQTPEPAGPVFFTMYVLGTKLVDSTPSCYNTRFDFLGLEEGVAATTMLPTGPLDSFIQSDFDRFAILFKHSWGSIRTGTFSNASGQDPDVSVQLLLGGTSQYFADSYTVTVTRVDNTGIYGTLRDVSFSNVSGMFMYLTVDSGSFHVPAPK